MDAIFGANAALIPWFVAALSAVLTLLAIMTALTAAKRAQTAAHDAERAAAALIDLHREGERLYAAWRSDVAALSRVVSAASSSTSAPRPSQPPPSAAPQPTPLVRPAPQAPLVATKRDDGDSTVPVMAPTPSSPTSSPAPLLHEPPDEEPAESTVMLGRGLAPAQPKDQFHGMPLLRVTLGSDSGREFKLPFETCTLGRASTNRVVLAENKASRVHAEIRFDGKRFFLRDAGSTNGTIRNGEQVLDEVLLTFGDVISIGKTELVFTCEGFDLKDSESARAIGAFERLLEREPNFVPGLQNLAFLLERDVARRRDAEGVWNRLKHLEG